MSGLLNDDDCENEAPILKGAGACFVCLVSYRVERRCDIRHARDRAKSALRLTGKQETLLWILLLI